MLILRKEAKSFTLEMKEGYQSFKVYSFGGDSLQ